MSKRTSSGTSLCTVLFVVFLTLKLTDVIGWSWWYVTMPLWAGVVFILSLGAVCFLVAAVWKMVDSIRGEKK